MNPKVLIAEDEKPVSQVLEIKLSRQGIDVETAYNGSEALEKINKTRFDLILLDLMMPEVDGFEVLKKIQEKKLQTPIFVTSNLSQEEDQEKAKSLGAEEYIVKSDTLLADIAEKVMKRLSIS